MKSSLAVHLALAAGIATAQTPQVLDVNTNTEPDLSSTPEHFAQIGQLVLFAATTPEYGRELWSYDTVTSQVAMVADIRTGGGSSDPNQLTVFQGHVYFEATGPNGSAGLWRTDGTSMELFDAALTGFEDAIEFAGRLFFRASSVATGFELWSTDGIATSVIELNPGAVDSQIAELTVIGSELWFRGYTPSTGMEVWRTDGTTSGTVLVADLWPGTPGTFAHSFYDLGGTAVFLDGLRARASDGTPAGTVDLGAASDMVGIGAKVYFTDRERLYETDGTAANTQLVTNLQTIPVNGSVRNMLAFGSRFFVNVTHGNNSPTEKTYLSDGTASGTVLLPVRMTTELAVAGNTAFFGGTAAGQGAEVWRCDGTVAGTAVHCETIAGPAGSWPQSLVAVDGVDELLFSSNVPGLGREPWRCDTTTGSGQLLANLADEGNATLTSLASELVDGAGKTWFRATTDSEYIWQTDGTAAGTHPIVPAGAVEFTAPSELTTIGAKVFFTAQHPWSGRELFVTDGTVAGTDMFDMWYQGGSNPEQLTVAEDLIYYFATNVTGGRSLWRTDGTQQGMRAISAQAGLDSVGDLVPLGRGLVFDARNPSSGLGHEPFYTDGTPQGTVLLGDLTPNGSSTFQGWATLGDRVFFVVNHTTLMATDGTPQGTNVVFSSAANLPDSIDQLFATRDRLYFRGFTAATGGELWCSDGTAASTAMVADLTTGGGSTEIVSYHAFGDRLLFEATVFGLPGLWGTDGTAANTVQLTDFPTPELIVAGEREAWFAGTDPLRGTELWRTDGTASGTGFHAELMPGLASSDPRDFALSGGRLYFRAEHPQFGVEPWVMQLGATSQDVGYGCTITTRVPPRLWSDDPVLGTTMQLHVAYGPDPGISALLFSNYMIGSLPLGSGLCDYFVAPNLLIFDLAVMPGGVANHQLVLPNAPSLVHERFRMQSLTIPNTSLAEVEMSNGLTLTLGY